MSCDRIIYFDGPLPSRINIYTLLTDYLDSSLVDVQWKGNRYFVTLRGKFSYALKNQVNAPSRARSPDDDDERWFEVVFGENNIDVITRLADEFTCAVADGLAKIIARFWSGRVEDK